MIYLPFNPPPVRCFPLRSFQLCPLLGRSNIWLAFLLMIDSFLPSNFIFGAPNHRCRRKLPIVFRSNSVFQLAVISAPRLKTQ